MIRVFPFLAAALAASAAHAAPGNLHDLLLAKTQAFSDAGQKGDKATLDALLAPDVAFTNEDGSMPTKADIVGSAGPPTPGVQTTIKTTDFKVTAHGPIAVCTFVDVLDETVRGQHLQLRYRSTEVWRKDPVGWRIIASQTLALADDPPLAKLPAAALDDYVGDYDAGSGVMVRITRTADGIASATGGGAPVALSPELKDVFFLPGQPRMRRIFERDASGRVVGYVSRTDGKDLQAHRVG